MFACVCGRVYTVGPLNKENLKYIPWLWVIQESYYIVCVPEFMSELHI